MRSRRGGDERPRPVIDRSVWPCSAAFFGALETWRGAADRSQIGASAPVEGKHDSEAEPARAHVIDVIFGLLAGAGTANLHPGLINRSSPILSCNINAAMHLYRNHIAVKETDSVKEQSHIYISFVLKWPSWVSD